ncbi:MAG: ABC transporter permease subunit [Treponema sp.]|nr:ABC transporter permease subunit [Treponema sp.]
MFYVLLLPAFAYIFIFNYMPMYGVQIAFKNFMANRGIWKSPWVGFMHFKRFFMSPDFLSLVWNTIILSIYQLVVGFPIPIIIALLINQCGSLGFKKFVQNVMYAPHFISIVVMVGMMQVMMSPRSGVINTIITLLGNDPVFFFGQERYFRHLYVWSGIWQSTGFNSIIYISVLAGVSQEMHEAAIVDGATKFKRILYIDLPSIMPTAAILLILSIGQMMSIGFDKVYLMQNSINLPVSEVISTYIYKKGILDTDYSFSSAVGLFNNVINFTLLIMVNKISRKLTGSSLW